MDIQGAELMALRGATRCLENAKALQIEVNYQQLYEGCVLISEMDEFLRNIISSAFIPKHPTVKLVRCTVCTSSFGDCTALGTVDVLPIVYFSTYSSILMHATWTIPQFIRCERWRNLQCETRTASPHILPNKVEERGSEFKDSSITGDPKPRPACIFRLLSISNTLLSTASRNDTGSSDF